MFNRISLWIEVLRRVAERRWFRTTAKLWAAIGFWDLVVSELLPPALAEKAPKLYSVLAMTSGWIPASGWLLAGAGLLVVGSLEFAVRVAGEAALLPKYRTARVHVDKGALDYLVGGLQAIEDVTKAVNMAADHTANFTRGIAGYTRQIVKHQNNHKRLHKIATKAARFITDYADRIQKTSDLIEAATPTIGEGTRYIIENSIISNDQERGALKGYIESIKEAANQAEASVVQIRGMQEAISGTKGISADLNAAGSHLHAVLGDLIQNTEMYVRTCRETLEPAVTKLQNSETIKV